MFDKAKYNKQYYKEHSEKAKAYSKQYQETHNKEIKTRKKKYYDNRTPEQIRWQLEEQAKSKQKLKLEVLTHYSTKSYPICADPFHKHLSNDPLIVDIRALSIDHINGGGIQERKEAKGDFYRKLKQREYPKGYQVLCMSCQYIKRYENNELRRL